MVVISGMPYSDNISILRYVDIVIVSNIDTVLADLYEVALNPS